MFGVGRGKCFLCGEKFGKNEVPKHYKNSGGTWEKVCRSCFRNVPAPHVKPGIHKGQRKQERDQGKLW